MILVFGGAYQGKYEFVKKNLIKNISETSDVMDFSKWKIISSFFENCTNSLGLGNISAINERQKRDELNKIAESAKKRMIWRNCDSLILWMVASGYSESDIHNFFVKAQAKNRVMIFRDVSQGVVPVDKVQRQFREINGRVMTYLAGRADKVYRVFCGIGTVLKQR